MHQPRLAKSRRFLRDGLAKLGPLPRVVEPIEFREETTLADAMRIASEFNGRLQSNGREIVVVTECGNLCPNLLALELLDPATAMGIGYLTLLFLQPTQEVTVGAFSLGEFKGLGFGRKLAEAFRGYLPQTARPRFRIEEPASKRFLLDLAAELMAAGRISDWREFSPSRPHPGPQEIAVLPLPEQREMERAFCARYPGILTPLFALIAACGWRFVHLSTGLHGSGRFIFEGYTESTAPHGN
jgi:hypothetical protein